MSNKAKSLLILLLLLIVFGMGYYSYNNNKKHDLVTAKLTTEKDIALEELYDLKEQYTEEIAKNTTLSEELSMEKDKISEFIDSIKKIKASSWRTTKFFKNKVKDLQEISDKYKKINDSLVASNEFLNIENENLTIKKDSLSDSLEEQTEYNTTLFNQNIDLARKIAIGEVIKMSNFEVSTNRTRRDQLKETDKARKVDVFKVSFTLNENNIAKSRGVTSHITITTPAGKLLLDRGTFMSNDDGELHYSDESTVAYKKNNITKNILIKFGDLRLEKGTYIIKLYIDHLHVGTVKKALR